MSPSWNFPKALPLRERLQNARFVPILIASIPYMHALVWYSMCVCRQALGIQVVRQAGMQAGSQVGMHVCMVGCVLVCMHGRREGGMDGWTWMDAALALSTLLPHEMLFIC